MNIKKKIIVIIGYISLVLGVLGTILPIMPTVPFLMVAAVCLRQKSDRLSELMSPTRIYIIVVNILMKVYDRISLSSNQLKLIAAGLMVIDHIGYFLFPECIVLRVIGRLSFPIFAYMIAEGCHYTKRPLRYLADVSILGIVCLAITVAGTGELYGNVLITFSMSIIIIMSIQILYRTYICNKGISSIGRYIKLSGAMLCLSAAIACSYTITTLMTVDYGYAGVCLPVLVYITKGIWDRFKIGDRIIALSEKIVAKSRNKKVCDGLVEANRRLVGYLDIAIGVVGLFIGLIILSLSMGGIQWVSLISVLPMALYSGKRGSKNLKLFFYLFYPAHIGVIQLIAMLIG